MKDDIDWKNGIPKESKQFHQKISEVVQTLPDERNGFSSKRYIPVLVLILLLVSSVTVYAAIRWNDRAAEHFGTNEKTQNSLTEEGYSSQLIQSVTNNGITVTLKQTIQDENLIYLLFTITSDKLKLTEDNAMSYDMKVSKGDGYYESISSGFVDKFTEPNISNSREYEIWINKNTGYDFNKTTLTCSFNGLQKYLDKAGSVEDLVKGQWDIKIALDTKDSVTLDLNKSVSIDGCEVLIHKIKISPLSYTIICDGNDVKELQKAKDINLDKLDSTYPLIISGIKYKDASIIQEANGLMSEGFDKTSGDFIATGRFSEAIDIDQVESIIFGDMKTRISIK